MRTLPFVLALAACTEPNGVDSGKSAEDSGSLVDADADGSPAGEDCDDADPRAYPGGEDVPHDGVDGDCDPLTCHGTGFAAAAVSHALPGGYGEAGSLPFEQAVGSADCSDATPAHELVDVSGDGRSDLVITYVCDDEATGDTRWLVHPGIEGGFAELAAEWTIPTDYGAEGAAPFARAESSAVCGDGIPGHLLTDLTGDALPDLVVTEVCDDAETGTTRWLVHPVGPSGWEEAPVVWELPAGFGAEDYPPFDLLERQALCPANRPGYVITDLDGDAAPDLVITERCDDTSVGTTHWELYRGEAEGFAATATSFALPLLGEADRPFALANGGPMCGTGVPEHALTDVSGDGLPDLVITEGCDGDSTVGDTRWLAYLNGGSSFASDALALSLPANYGADGTSPFSAEFELSPASDGTPAHRLTDVDGDTWADLVVLASEDDATLGASRWAVHLGGPAGFAEAPMDWALPAAGGSTPFAKELSPEASCPEGAPVWSLTDLDGDALPEILVTADCSSEVGAQTWSVFPAECEQ